MYIYKITYIARGQASISDDIFTLDITGYKGGVPIRNIMISGHSLVVSGRSYTFGADVDTLVVEATDLDFDGHTIELDSIQYQVPRTGSITKTYQFDVSGGTPAVAQIYTPAVALAATYAAPPPAYEAPLQSLLTADAVIEPMAIDTTTGEPVVVQKAGIGLGVLVIGGLILLGLSKRKKR